MSTTAETIRKNYLSVKERAEHAAKLAGRDPNEITIIGVTKYVDAEMAGMLCDAGCKNLGESRPQVLDEKAATLTDPEIVWHMIGHLQRNKVARTLRRSTFLHSVDSLRLAESINRIAGENQQSVEILLEVNVSGETAKHGFTAEEMPEVVDRLLPLPYVNLRGLMCMAGLTSNDDETRRQFQKLRELCDALQQRLPDDHQFTELSMGMSGDFEVAIAEGATMVRVGSILFDGVR